MVFRKPSNAWPGPVDLPEPEPLNLRLPAHGPMASNFGQMPRNWGTGRVGARARNTFELGLALLALSCLLHSASASTLGGGDAWSSNDDSGQSEGDAESDGGSTNIRERRSNHHHHHHHHDKRQNLAHQSSKQDQPHSGSRYHPKSPLSRVQEGTPTRDKEIARRLRMKGIDPTAKYPVSEQIKMLGAPILGAPVVPVERTAMDLVKGNQAVVNLAWDRNGIPLEIYSIKNVNSDSRMDMEAYIENVSKFVGFEIVEALKSIDIDPRGKVNVFAPTVRAGWVRAGDSGHVRYLSADNGKIFEVMSDSGSSKWFAIGLHRENFVADITGDAHDIPGWLAKDGNAEWFFDAEKLRGFRNAESGNLAFSVEFESGQNFEDALGKHIHEVVEPIVRAAYEAGSQPAPMEQLQKSVHGAVPFLSGVQDIADKNPGGFAENFGNDFQVLKQGTGSNAVRGPKETLPAIAGMGDKTDNNLRGFNGEESPNFAEQATETDKRGGAVRESAQRGLADRDCILDLSAGRGRRGAECVGYWHPSLAQSTEMSQSVKQQVDGLKAQIASDKTLIGFIKSPARKSEQALERTMAIAREAGHQPKVLGAGLFYNLERGRSANHFAAVIEINGAEYIVDPTAHEFADHFSGPFIGTKDEWLRMFSSPGRSRPVVAYKISTDSQSIKTTFDAGRLAEVDVLNLPSDMKVHSEAEWFRRAKLNPAGVENLNRQESRAVQQWKKKLKARREGAARDVGRSVVSVKSLPGRITELANRITRNNRSNLARRLAQGGVCWDAVIDFQQEVRMISDEAASELHTVTRGNRFDQFLRGARQVTTPQEFSKVAAGLRIGFIDINDNSMKHAMLSVGEGRAIGVNNGFLDPKFAPGWASIDITRGLKWNGGLVYSSDNRVAMRVMVGSSDIVRGG